MSPIFMSLSSCILFAIRTRGSSDLIDRRPPVLPRALAAASPARVRSWIRRLSNWASEEKMLNTSSPDAVVVSMAPSQRDRKPTPPMRSSSISPTIRHRPAETVQAPDQECIAGRKLLKTSLEPGPIRAGTRGFVRYHVKLMYEDKSPEQVQQALGKADEFYREVCPDCP